jgi:putative selenate reductase
MPAQREELHAARAEGVELLELAAPCRVVAPGGRLTALVCSRMRLGEPDASGRPRPVETGAELELPLDTLIVAVGQRAYLDLLAGLPVERDASGFIRVDGSTLETSVAGIFAGGDAVQPGPASIVAACGHGRRIAAAIRRRVEGVTTARPAPALPVADVVDLLGRRARRPRRVVVPELPLAARNGFAEVAGNLSAEEAVREASRCLACDRMCSTCVTVCPNRALLTYRCDPLRLTVPVLERRGAEAVVCGHRPFTVEQGLQVALLADLCNQCGNCATFCPTQGKPFADKPRLFLSRSALEQERDNAFLIARGDGTLAVEARFAGATHELVSGVELRYRSPAVEAVLDPGSFALRSATFRGAAGDGERFSLEQCATMLAVLRGVGQLEPWLPGAETGQFAVAEEAG